MSPSHHLYLFPCLQQALCAPSRNSFLTSRRPDSLHLYDFYSYWRNTVGNFTTLPQHFKNNGYYAHSIGKIFHPGASSNFSDDARYSWSAPPYHPPTEVFKEAKVCVNDDGSLGRNLICPVVVDEQPGGSLPDLQSLNAALDFLKYKDKISNNLPYFLAVGFHKPHIPLKFPVEYLGNNKNNFKVRFKFERCLELPDFCLLFNSSIKVAVSEILTILGIRTTATVK